MQSITEMLEEIMEINEKISEIKRIHSDIKKLEESLDQSNVNKYLFYQINLKKNLTYIEEYINKVNYFYATLDNHKEVFETLKTLYVNIIKDISPETIDKYNSTEEEDVDIDLSEFDNANLFEGLSDDEYNTLFEQINNNKSDVEYEALRDYLHNIIDNNSENVSDDTEIGVIGKDTE